MSTPRYDWWPYVKGMIRRYPELARRYGAEERGSGIHWREYQAVRRAVETTAARPNGDARLKVIRLVLWEGRTTVEGAALAAPCSVRHAKEWHGDFIRLTARYFGLLEEEKGTPEPAARGRIEVSGSAGSS